MSKLYGQKTYNVKYWKHRFWSKVEIGYNSCWIWLAGKDKDGYGKFSFGPNGKQRYVRSHRVSYYMYNGIFSQELLLIHKCDNPSCVNPYHLRIGTQSDNIKDAVEKGRHSVLPGEKHPRSILTNKEVYIIRNSLLKDGQLAKELGVSRSTIQNIRSNRHWRHLL